MPGLLTIGFIRDIILRANGVSMQRVPAKLVSWKEINRWCSDVSAKVIESDYRPDVIIGMARGGWVPARLLCDGLGVKNLLSLKTAHWGVTASQDSKARLIGSVGGDIEGKDVLIVDDITDTGESLKLAFEHALSLNPRNLRTATMLHINHSAFKPDYYASEIPKEGWKWFVFPWNYMEDMNAFISRILQEGAMNTEEISRELMRRNGLKVETRHLSALLKRLDDLGTVVRSGKKWSIRLS